MYPYCVMQLVLNQLRKPQLCCLLQLPWCTCMCIYLLPGVICFQPEVDPLGRSASIEFSPFCSCGNIFLLHSFWSFAVCKILGWVFSFSTLHEYIAFLMRCQLIILSRFPLQVIFLLQLSTFFLLDVQHFNYDVSGYGFLLIYPSYISWACWMCKFIFIIKSETFQPWFLQISFLPPFPFSLLELRYTLHSYWCA